MKSRVKYLHELEPNDVVCYDYGFFIIKERIPGHQDFLGIKIETEQIIGSVILSFPNRSFIVFSRVYSWMSGINIEKFIVKKAKK